MTNIRYEPTNNNTNRQETYQIWTSEGTVKTLIPGFLPKHIWAPHALKAHVHKGQAARRATKSLVLWNQTKLITLYHATNMIGIKGEHYYQHYYKCNKGIEQINWQPFFLQLLLSQGYQRRLLFDEEKHLAVQIIKVYKFFKSLCNAMAKQTWGKVIIGSWNEWNQT